jgi:hypothetical protein
MLFKHVAQSQLSLCMALAAFLLSWYLPICPHR